MSKEEILDLDKNDSSESNNKPNGRIEHNLQSIIIILLVVLIALDFHSLYSYITSDTEETAVEADNDKYSYFLEPEGCIIAKVHRYNKISYAYGYITEEDYKAYQDGTLKGALYVRHPYEEGKGISVSVDSIESIETGIYKDLR